MHSRYQKRGYGSNIIFIAVLACIILLIYPSFCVSEIKINSKHSTSFFEDEDMIIDWNYNYEKQLHSYGISVKEYNSNKEIWHDNKILNEEIPGLNSPIIGSINLGKRNAGSYIVEMDSKPIDPNIKGDSISVLVKISKPIGYGSVPILM